MKLTKWVNVTDTHRVWHRKKCGGHLFTKTISVENTAPMNSNEISRLQATLEGAYPTSRISPSKVFDTWNACRELQEFPNARRSDLINLCLERYKEFPSLPQLLDAARALLKAERGPTQTCLICDGTGWVHFTADGELGIKQKTIRVRDADIVFTYNGKPIEYGNPTPCIACSH
jgi:hypothetical protein